MSRSRLFYFCMFLSIFFAGCSTGSTPLQKFQTEATRQQEDCGRIPSLENVFKQMDSDDSTYVRRHLIEYDSAGEFPWMAKFKIDGIIVVLYDSGAVEQKLSEDTGS